MENVINKLVREKANFYIFGDYNINLLKTDEKYNISEFVNSMHSHNALNMINKPTRFLIGNQKWVPVTFRSYLDKSTNSCKFD